MIMEQKMKENVKILLPDINLPGIILTFFENNSFNPDKPSENQYHFVIYRNNEIAGGLVILADDDISVKIKHFHLHHELPHRYLCRKLVREAHHYIREKGFTELEIDIELEGTPFYEMLQNELKEVTIYHEAEELSKA